MMMHTRRFHNPYLVNKRGNPMKNRIIEIINEWNPIEIYPLLEDEYYSESKKLIEAIGKSNSIEELA